MIINFKISLKICKNQFEHTTLNFSLTQNTKPKNEPRISMNSSLANAIEFPVGTQKHIKLL